MVISEKSTLIRSQTEISLTCTVYVYSISLLPYAILMLYVACKCAV